MNKDNIQRSLGRIEGMLKSLNDRMEKIELIPIACNERFNILEKYKDKQSGVIVTIGAIAGIGASKLIDLLLSLKK